jgi:protein-S-isoprenylcysteine O-methyltransferase Ste14
MRRTASWRWKNVPLPEPHLAGLGVGVLLHFIWSWRLFGAAWIGHSLGWPLIPVGLWVMAWAVRAAAGLDLARPGKLVRAGPYAYSRNPMYLAWTFVYAGIACVVNTVWPLLLLPLVLLVVHVTVVREERSLERRFTDAYRSYKSSVRRYL